MEVEVGLFGKRKGTSRRGRRHKRRQCGGIKMITYIAHMHENVKMKPMILYN
jgi:hypothetical protein